MSNANSSGRCRTTVGFAASIVLAAISLVESLTADLSSPDLHDES